MAYDTYRGVEITDTYFTGHKSVILPTLKRSAAAIMRSDRSYGFCYVGIASGHDYWFALKRRIDTYKLECGIVRMSLLYQSSSQDVVRELEDGLIDHISGLRPDTVLNRTSGGGGRNSKGPLFFIYLAVAHKLE